MVAAFAGCTLNPPSRPPVVSPVNSVTMEDGLPSEYKQYTVAIQADGSIALAWEVRLHGERPSSGSWDACGRARWSLVREGAVVDSSAFRGDTFAFAADGVVTPGGHTPALLPPTVLQTAGEAEVDVRAGDLLILETAHESRPEGLVSAHVDARGGSGALVKTSASAGAFRCAAGVAALGGRGISTGSAPPRYISVSGGGLIENTSRGSHAAVYAVPDASGDVDSCEWRALLDGEVAGQVRSEQACVMIGQWGAGRMEIQLLEATGREVTLAAFLWDRPPTEPDLADLLIASAGD